MIRHRAGLAVLLIAVALCAFIGRFVPPQDGGLMPSGILLLTLTALALRRRTVPRPRRAA